LILLWHCVTTTYNFNLSFQIHHWNKNDIQHDVSDLVSKFPCIHHYSVPRYVNMFNVWHCSTGTINWQFTLDQPYTVRSVCLGTGTVWRVFKLSVQQTVHLYRKSTLSLIWSEQFHQEKKYAVCRGWWKCSVNRTKCRNRPTSLYI